MYLRKLEYVVLNCIAFNEFYTILFQEGLNIRDTFEGRRGPDPMSSVQQAVQDMRFKDDDDDVGGVGVKGGHGGGSSGGRASADSGAPNVNGRASGDDDALPEWACR